MRRWTGVFVGRGGTSWLCVCVCEWRGGTAKKSRAMVLHLYRRLGFLVGMSEDGGFGLASVNVHSVENSAF